jgi:hypothetical protein
MEKNYALIPVSNEDLKKMNDLVMELLGIFTSYLVKLPDKIENGIYDIDDKSVLLIKQSLECPDISIFMSPDMISEFKDQIKAYNELCKIRKLIICLSNALQNTAFISINDVYVAALKNIKNFLMKQID